MRRSCRFEDLHVQGGTFSSRFLALAPTLSQHPSSCAWAPPPLRRWLSTPLALAAAWSRLSACLFSVSSSVVNIVPAVPFWPFGQVEVLRVVVTKHCYFPMALRVFQWSRKNAGRHDHKHLADSRSGYFCFIYKYREAIFGAVFQSIFNLLFIWGLPVCTMWIEWKKETNSLSFSRNPFQRQQWSMAIRSSRRDAY